MHRHRPLSVSAHASLKSFTDPLFFSNLVAGGDVDHIEREIGQLGAESRNEIVAAAFHKYDVEIIDARGQTGDRFEIARRVLANRGVRAAGYSSELLIRA